MDDALLIALISESVNAASIARRRAAVILAHTLRSGRSITQLLEQSRPTGVDAEIKALVEDYQIQKD